jgi:glyceraldehyde 3-phosphate dehydrogenase
MTPERLGLMGFGRVGRNLFRILYKAEDVQIGAISDIADHAGLEYLLKFDTILGRFPDAVSVRDGYLYAAGRQTRLLSGAKPGDVDWAELGVTTVVEATGASRPRAELEKHFERGAERVVLCVPPLDPPDATVVVGVNDHVLRREHRIVSNASCTAHCAAPVLAVLDGAFGIERAFLTTVHAYTNQQRLADVPAEDPRRGRAAAENIIPQETNAAEVVMELLPALAGRLTGSAINVPVPNGSVVDLVCWHRGPVTQTAINEVVRTAASTDRWRRTLAFEPDPIVSSDIVRSPYSATFDAQATMVIGDRMSKTLAWFDNGWGYAHRVVDLVRRFAALDAAGVEAA